ncbi:glycosyl transferase family 90-domain-containing protein [Lineolata rhizophorae]|uniref:Glycosyl transferase family 90-domain-containing protein n=1 Tax=Lineolata rhizophorae TaxID=578093 RepID=A0A6A6NY71_9PEZI|nr:glycosyl transferase family 90-domain-containing protein [Lineolata rhizophorae]
MLSFFARRVSTVAAVTAVVFLIIFFTLLLRPSHIDTLLPSDHFSAPHPLPVPQNTTDGWSFAARRDARNYALSKEQCDAAFPGLYDEIYRAANFRDDVGPVTPEDVDITWRADGVVRVLLYQNQLYIVDARGVARHDYRDRSLAVLHSLNRAVETFPDLLPNIEFSFAVDDMAEPSGNSKTIWSLARLPEKEKQWLMPDFGFWSWPVTGAESYNELRRQIAEEEDYFDNKLPMVMWRGALNVNKERKNLMEITKDKDWADVKDIDWSNKTLLYERLVSMVDHCKYKYLIHTEGRSYSGRLKYIQNCESVIIIPELAWIQNYHHLLVPSGEQQNYVLVEKDFSDLEEKITYLLEHDDEANRIATNSISMFRDRYLTQAAQACYWRELIRSWANVSFQPQLYEEVDSTDEVTGHSSTTRKLRGTTFETYV